MNHALRGRVSSFVLFPRAAASPWSAGLSFHSTTVLDRRRISRYKFDSYVLRSTRKDAKRILLHDANLYLDHLMHGFRNSRHGNSPNLSSSHTSWFEKQYFSRGRKNRKFCKLESQWKSYMESQLGKGPAQFCKSSSDDEGYESIFGCTNGGEQSFYQSFHRSGSPNGSTRYEQKHSSWNWKHESGYEDTKATKLDLDLVSERHVLGLSTSGPLKLKDIKNAYHSCALRWHPDRHQGSVKVDAEEKFKQCTAAYKTLCDKLAAA